MGDLVTITTTGRATADVELKTSTNGKNTKYVQFGLAVHIPQKQSTRSA